MLPVEPQSFDRVLSSMCTEPHPVAREAAIEFLATNPGDPATYPGVAKLETRAIDRLGEIVGLADPAGYLASGGTEANIQAVRIARNEAAIARPNMVVPDSGHFSFDKAAELLGVELRRCPATEDGRADPAAMTAQMDDRTILCVAVAGSTEYGRVDPVLEIAEIASDQSVHCHVDAAWGGFVLPFTEYPWQFSEAPIDTMTIDPHKLGRAAIPAGGLLARDPDRLEALRVETPYLEAGSQRTLQGTRSGAGVASAAAVLEECWRAGYARQFDRLQQTTEWLTEELTSRGLAPIEPTLPIVSVPLPDRYFQTLRDQGWRIARTSAGELRIVVMPHVTESVLEAFLSDLDEILQPSEQRR